MPSNLNAVILSGRFVRDPELMKTKSGISVCVFALAVNSTVKEGGAWVESANFVNVKTFGKTAEALCKNNTKGMLITIQGHLMQDKFTKKDGTSVDRLVVICDKAFYNDQPRRKGTDNDYVDSPDVPASASSVEVDEGDLPF